MKPTPPSRSLAPLLALLGLAACNQARPIPVVARTTCPSPQLFDHAVCVCEDLTSVGDLDVRQGTAATAASVGVNGMTDLVATAHVEGTWYAWGGFSAVGASIGDALVTPGDVDLVGDAVIRGDAVVGGDLHAVGALAIGGTLQLRGDADLVGRQAIAARAPYVAPAGPPCGCDDQRFFDVAGAVALAREQLGAGGWSTTGSSELHLATGSYYVTQAELVGDTRIVVDGNASVFVDGSLATVGSARWVLAEGGQLDLFVAGDVDLVGNLVAGDRARPGAFRLYVGGDRGTTVDTVGTTRFYGSLYAPRAAVSYVGDTTIVGSIFARTIEGTGQLAIEEATPIAPPSSCAAPPPGGPLGLAART